MFMGYSAATKKGQPGSATAEYAFVPPVRARMLVNDIGVI
jgi:hypothetical protein